MICRKFCAIALALSAIFAAAEAAHAAAITGAMYEPFNYPATTQFGLNSANNGGFGWNATGDPNVANAATTNWGATGIPGAHAGSAALKTAVTPGLTYSATGYANGTGNKLQLNDPTTPVGSQNIGRLIGTQAVDAGTFYFSFLSEKNNDTTRSMNLAFMTSLTTPNERFAVGQFSGTLTTNGNIGMILLGNNASLVSGTTAYGINTTHLIVGKVQFDTAALLDTITLWVDPTDVTTEAAAGTFYLQNSTTDIGSITTIRPFVGSVSGAIPAVSADFDEIRIGGTWEAVTSATVVPEPAAAALLAAGALALVAGRRRR